MRKVLNKIKLSWQGVKSRWAEKDYDQKSAFLGRLNMFLVFATIASMFINPVLQLVLSLSVITVGVCGIVNIRRKYKAKEAEIQAKLVDDSNKLTESSIKKRQEEIKMSLDKDTREAMESLFNAGEESSVKSSDETIVNEPEYSGKEFNKLFN